MKTSLGKNFSLLMAANLLTPVFSMALVLAISRLQGVEMLGKYSLMMTVFVLGQGCAVFGLPIIITREVARAREDAGRYFVNACILTAAILVPIIVIALPTLHATMTDRSLAWAMSLVLLALLPSLATTYAEAILLAFERAQDFVALGLAENILRAVIGTVLVFAGYGITAIALSILALRCAASIAFLVVLRRRDVRLPFSIDGTLCRSFLRELPVIGAIPIVNALYARIDIFLLSWLGTWTEVGLYSAAVRLVDVARSIPPAYGRALYPILSRLRATSVDAFTRTARQSIRDVLLLIVPVALLLSGLAQPLIVLLYGPSLEAASISLRVLAWTLVPVTLATTLAQMLFADAKQAIDLRVNIIASVVAIACNIAFIPLWGAAGAAIATMFSATIYACLQYMWVKQHVADPASMGHVGKLLAVSVPSLALMLVLVHVNPLLTAGMALVTFAAGLALSGAVDRADLRRVKLSWASFTRSRLGAAG